MRSLSFAVALNAMGPALFILMFLIGFGDLDQEAARLGYSDIVALCTAQPNALRGDSCYELMFWAQFKPWAWVIGIAGIVLPIINYMAPSVLGTSPQRLAAVYPALFPFTLAFSMIQVILGLGYLGIAGHIFMSWVLGVIWWYAYIAFGFGAIVVIWRSLMAVGKFFGSKPGIEFGVRATREDSPELFDIVERMATRLNSKPPVNLVVGPSPNFYITDVPLRILPSNEVLKGETVFISATLAEVMSRDELASIVAHELMHYKGEDLKLTRRFYPIYRRLHACVDELSRSGHVMAMPILYNLDNLHGGFATAERKISRERELAADAGAASATSPKTAAGALLKASLFSSVWPSMLHDHAIAMSQGEKIEDAPGALYGYLVYETNEDSIESHIGQVMKTRLAHPVDTHPTLAERLDSWGVSIDELERDYYADYDRDRSASLFSEDFIARVTDVFESETYNRINFRLPHPDDPDALAERRLNQAIYGVVEHAIRADGEVQPEEVVRAEDLCRKHFGGFSSLLFRERLHGDVAPAPLETLVADIVELLPAQKRPELRTLVNEIIDADGEVAPGEEKMRTEFFALLDQAEAGSPA